MAEKTRMPLTDVLMSHVSWHSFCPWHSKEWRLLRSGSSTFTPHHQMALMPSASEPVTVS